MPLEAKEEAEKRETHTLSSSPTQQLWGNGEPAEERVLIISMCNVIKSGFQRQRSTLSVSMTEILIESKLRGENW